METSTYQYQYFIKDHLGSVRVCFTDNPATPTPDILQVNDYYPFGMSFADSGPNNPYKYNGKELYEDHGLDWYDYGARFYDPQIGRWHVVDPMAEKYYGWSPYNYVADNPLKFVDSDGRILGWFMNEETNDVYFNSSYRKSDVGKGEMRGSGWRWMGDNNMFTNGNTSKTLALISMNKKLSDIYRTQSFPDGSVMFEIKFSGLKAEKFMSTQRFEKKPHKVDVYRKEVYKSLPEGEGPIWNISIEENIEKVHSWTYSDKKGGGSYSVEDYYKHPNNNTDINQCMHIRERWETRDYNYNNSPPKQTPPLIQFLMNTVGLIVSDQVQNNSSQISNTLIE